MKIEILQLSLCTVICLASSSAQSFELVTHAVVTDRAYEWSVLKQSPDLLGRLGLFDLNLPFGSAFYDFWDTGSRKRFEDTYEASKIPDADRNRLRIRGWLMRGAIREDDSGRLAAMYHGEPYETDPDPLGLIDRSCNHFFDPVARRALWTSVAADPTVFLYCPNEANNRAPDWALGTADAFVTNPEAIDGYRNHFTIFSAREAMWRALTLRTGAGAPAPRASDDNSEKARSAYWATTFRALGDVVHLNQDMAQPQHSRNEPHGLGHAALFEKYLDARAAGLEEFKFDGQGKLLAKNGQLPQLPLETNYPIPRFDRYSDYWSTATGGALSGAKGLADYSSRGFFTPRKNVGAAANDFLLPVPYPNVYTPFYTNPSQYEPCLFGSPTGPGNLGVVKYLLGSVPDSLTNSADTVRMASIGMMDGQYGLDRCVLDDRINLLIPRAIAYSAGIVDYFFRGQLEVTPPDEGVYSLLDHYDFSGDGKSPTDSISGFKGFKSFKLKLRNVTPDIVNATDGLAHPQGMTGGSLVAVVKFRRHISYTDDLAGEPANLLTYLGLHSGIEEIVVSSRVKSELGQSLSPPISIGSNAKTYVFEFDQELPINATDIILQVVYRGRLGTEADAVVVETIDISEPTYFAYMNATDYIHIGNTVYTRDELNADTAEAAALRSMVRPASCIAAGKLKVDCLMPYPIGFPLKWGTSPIPSAWLDLPAAGNYSRFAMLTPPGVAAVIDQSASYCLPNDSISVSGRREQTRFLTDPDAVAGYSVYISLDYLRPPVRGVNGWHTIACVNNGDGSVPGEIGDDRYVKMLPLMGNHLKPRQTVGFQFGAL